MLRYWALATIAVIVVFLGLTAVVKSLTALPIAESIRPSGQLVVIGVPRLTWDDISPQTTPALWNFSQTGAVAALTTRAYDDHSCPSEAWLTLSAGYAASTFDNDCYRKVLPDIDTSGEVNLATWPQWNGWRSTLMSMDPQAPIGMLASTYAQQGQCISGYGSDALLGAANQNGVARINLVGLNEKPACRLSFFSLSSINDALIGNLVLHLPPDATVVIAGMGDADGPTSLHAVMMAGPTVKVGMLTSRSTRQPGFLQVTDLTSLALSWLDHGTPSLVLGRVPTVMPTSPQRSVEVATDLTRALNIEQPFVAGFFGLFLGSSAALLAIGALRWVWITYRSRPNRTAHRRLRGWFAWIGASCASMPAATFLIGLFPWWRSSHPRTMLCIGIGLICLTIAALSLLGPWRKKSAGPMTFVAATTFIVIAEDVLAGSRLQLIAVMGLQPVYGGRYYGMGNVGAALWVTSALILAAMCGNYLYRRGSRGLASITIMGIGVVTLVIDSVPWWGNKAGAMLAITPAFAYLALAASGLKMTWRRAIGIAGITIALAALFTVINTMVPLRDRTHIGNFGAEILRGNFHGLWNIIRLNWEMLTSSWLNGSVLVLIIGIVIYFIRPNVVARPLEIVFERLPLLGPCVSAVMVCWLLAFFAEDSGTGVPPTGLLVLAPMLTLLAARIPATANPQH